MELNNIFFIFVLAIVSFLLNKYILKIFHNSKYNLLADIDYKKPQSFHQKSTFRLGGITIFLSLFIISFYLFFSKNIYFYEYISFSALFFLLGLLDDLKINILPKFRLGIMILFLIVLIISNDFYLEKSGLEFLNHLLKIDIFSLIFMVLCFLFIINGANLIDGFNGLLTLHSLIIFIVLFLINFINQNTNLAYVLFFIILALIIFLKFNFPKANMFLGDSGAYLIGALIAVSIIKTSLANPMISPFFFCVLLVYLFFEVFFSFFRKIFIVRQSPLLPDNKHLHMILYKFLFKKNKSKLTSNYMVSVCINAAYLLLVIPAIILMYNGLFCRFYFFILIVFYFYFYNLLNKKVY